VPSLATMIMGLMTGEMLRRPGTKKQKLWTLVIAGVACCVAGLIAGAMLCPLVKRIWTPSWVLYSGGWVLLMLAAFYAVNDVLGGQKWSLPFTVIGMNSIFVYLGFQLSAGWIRTNVARHVSQDLFTGDYTEMARRTSVLIVLWLMAWWLYRQRVFLRL
jgi:predicted acyltransferase